MSKLCIYSGTLILEFNWFQKAVREAICSKTDHVNSIM